MLLYCVKCKEIYGCLKKNRKEKECLGCINKENCPLDIIYPRQDVKISICQHCKTKAIWEIHEKIHGPRA